MTQSPGPFTIPLVRVEVFFEVGVFRDAVEGLVAVGVFS